MNKLEEVINGLEFCLNYKCNECQQENHSGYPWDCPRQDELVREAFELLKTQKSVEPREDSKYPQLFGVNAHGF